MPTAVPEYDHSYNKTDRADESCRLFEDESQSVVDVRTESLSSLRELGPPDLVHLVKQPVKSATKQVCLEEITHKVLLLIPV